MLTAVKRKVSIKVILTNPEIRPDSPAAMLFTRLSNYIIVVFATRMDFSHWRA